MWTQRSGCAIKSLDCCMFCSHRKLSFASMGIRVGLILFFSARVPLNFWRLQNLIAHRPSGSPSVVTARLECIKIPQTVWIRDLPALSFPLLVLPVNPTCSGSLRWYENSVVS
jgi:hypothetical protein